MSCSVCHEKGGVCDLCGEGRRSEPRVMMSLDSGRFELWLVVTQDGTVLPIAGPLVAPLEWHEAYRRG